MSPVSGDTSIPNTPMGSIDPNEYVKVQTAIDGLSLLLQNNKYESLQSKLSTTTTETPIEEQYVDAFYYV